MRQITFHELRHTFDTQMAAAGAPLRAIQEWTGHADAKTTEIYRHYAPDPTHGPQLSSLHLTGLIADEGMIACARSGRSSLWLPSAL